jgi:perosamine synthetase
VERRRENAAWYREELTDVDWLTFSPELSWARNAYWMSCVLVSPGAPVDRDELMERLAERGIETRPFFYPLHTLPPYAEGARGPFPIAEDLAAHGLNLPSSALLSREDVAYVAREISRVAVGASRVR